MEAETGLAPILLSSSLDWVCLRYFNVAGAVSSQLGDHGENNLIPRVFRALTSGINPKIFGGNYSTPDGTCIRDYIHVDDVAEAHAEVMQRMEAEDPAATYNIGTGAGTSVLEVMLAVKRWGICLWPLIRRKDRSALSMPAAV